MSRLLINHYLNQLADLRKVSGTHRESVVREAFKDLLKGWGRARYLTFVPEFEIDTPAKERRYVDGALVDELRIPLGYWEAKDAKDDLDAEIAYKRSRGYPTDNIIFEDSTEAVLIQNKEEVLRCPIDDTAALERLLNLFFGFERAEIGEFRRAVEQFKTDIPAVLDSLREMIGKAYAAPGPFRAAADAFLAHAREAINPSLIAADVREMLIQHILTEEIFSKVFGEDDFHRQNNVAKKLYDLEGTFFTGDLKKRTLKGLDAYYAAIRSAAARIGSHHEKQTFLKTIYENFYKVYNPKAADRLGVVYTPNEIVRFMIDGADHLCERHFGRNLIDADVEILDPAAGTGTFICELIEHFRGQPGKLKHKYLEELHANEVAILPYYTANLNIEATYAAIAGEYLEYPNLCFVDTLDNTFGLRKEAGHQDDLFGSMSEENVERIRRQNRRRISVVIGNPPYNANQMNENENNKNREYPEIDRRIKATYIKASTAQKTKLYDMYARFFRWASDRVDENGIVAFVSNRSFIDSRTFDGFRKVVAEEFSEIWIVDLKGNARTSGEQRRREGGNVFDDQIRVGVAVYFCIKKKGANGCRIFYEAVRDYARSEEKREFLASKPLAARSFEEVRPDANHNWINLTANDFDTFIPIASKETKAAKTPGQERAVFSRAANAVKTNRDEWVYEFDLGRLQERVTFLIEAFNRQLVKGLSDSDALDYSIKWSSGLKAVGQRIAYNPERVTKVLWRPFVHKLLYVEKLLSDRLTQNHFDFFGPALSSLVPTIYIPCPPMSKEPHAVAAAGAADYHVTGDALALPLEYQIKGSSRNNITDWALDQFRSHYGEKPGITKEAIFHYCYAVLHDPIYREKYAQNLKREFPRIPFYPDFAKWATWGKALMDLHIGYETVEPWPLTRTDDGRPSPVLVSSPVIASEAKQSPAIAASATPPRNDKESRALLKADREHGRIFLDTCTTLTGIPSVAWDYRLGNRSALEWILDQHKEKKPKDPTIREKFNTYRFADHKERVIDLIARVTAVSVATQEIVEAMREAKREG
jgi:predicted helicase